MSEHPIVPISASDPCRDLSLESAQLLKHPPTKRVIKTTAILSLVLILSAGLLPWQQNVQARGEVTALRPSDRPQTVPTIIGGRIEQWLVAEGDYVTRGTPLVRLTDVKDAYLDPTTLERYREQLGAKRSAVEAKREKVIALDAQLRALEEGLVLSLEQKRNSVALYRAAVEAAQADSAVAGDQASRREGLYRDGLSSLNDLQSARLKAQQANAKLVEKRQELASAEVELRAVRASYEDKIAKARSERSATAAEVSEGVGEVSKLRNATDNLAARVALYTVTAPQDGYVVQALRAGVGEQVKEGEAIVTIMPGTPQQAVALYVSATDVPLLSNGRKVRLQFDGWPALQFSGWPNAAVGTFGGEIAVVDQVAQPDGRYRILVRPDTTDTPWPAQVRQGSGVLGWAMLDQVTLGYELWRRLNGFPPVVQQPADPSAKK